jgi:hypothetical protein
MKGKLTLRNDFHNTETTVRSIHLSARTVRRVENTLCGIWDCKCGGIRMRGITVEPHQDGSLTIIDMRGGETP